MSTTVILPCFLYYMYRVTPWTGWDCEGQFGSLYDLRSIFFFCTQIWMDVLLIYSYVQGSCLAKGHYVLTSLGTCLVVDNVSLDGPLVHFSWYS